MTQLLTFRFAAVALAAAACCAPALAAKRAAGTDSIYAKERADCNTGRTAEDRATCLKEAGAAQDERRRNRLDNSGSMDQNAVDRCKALPNKDRADCLARINGPKASNQQVTTSGSVAGGGLLRETTTTTIVPAAAPSAPR